MTIQEIIDGLRAGTITKDDLKGLVKVPKIFGYKTVYVYVANLANESLFFPYLGRWGYRLPALSKETTPIRKFIRTHKTYKVRKNYYYTLLTDIAEGRISVSPDPAEVAADIQAALNPPVQDEDDTDSNT